MSWIMKRLYFLRKNIMFLMNSLMKWTREFMNELAYAVPNKSGTDIVYGNI